jgi:hypothetical protein
MVSSSSSTAASGSHRAGWHRLQQQQQQQHVEGGLFLSAALMGSAAERQSSWPHQGSIPRPVSPAAGGGLLQLSPGGRVLPAVLPSVGSGVYSSSGLYSSSGSGAVGSHEGAGAGSRQQSGAIALDLHRTSSGITYSYTGTGHSPGGRLHVLNAPAAVGAGGVAGGGLRSDQGPGLVSSRQQQQQQQVQVVSGGVRVSRSGLVVWLRAALDVLAALTQVDPSAALMELSHKLAGEGGSGGGRGGGGRVGKGQSGEGSNVGGTCVLRGWRWQQLAFCLLRVPACTQLAWKRQVACIIVCIFKETLKVV